MRENESAYEPKSVPVGLGPPPGALGLLGPIGSPQDWICCCSCPTLRENKRAHERESVPVCRLARQLLDHDQGGTVGASCDVTAV
ncbi:hypothetical protein NDU88_002696 [Pleurodeles waltl]|uniref:Uncharacterized protein n=1 Tax=Pleurodeles waltl TaxID=8319 RepID=A0AAV7KSV5_PLEWA|nr:hypothetical protein NDU88_002696 [Pleurodeles waltl]